MSESPFIPEAETPAACGDQQSPEDVTMALAVPMDPDADPGPVQVPDDDGQDEPVGGDPS